MNKQAQYRQRHKEQGLCIDCSRPVHPPHIRCVEHLHNRNKGQMLYYRKNSEKILNYHRKVKQRRKDSGLCVVCGNEKDVDIDEGKVKCQNCREEICCER